MQALKAVWTVPALILTAFVLLGNVVRIAGATSQETPEPGFRWKDGAEVCAKVCATIRGRGLAPAYITFIVRHGNRAMPSFRAAEIDDESLAKVAEYVSKAAANQ